MFVSRNFSEMGARTKQGQSGLGCGIRIWCKQGFISNRKFNQIFIAAKKIACNRLLQI